MKASGSRKTDGLPRDLFVGRQAELARVADLLDEARSGEGRFVAISGEPGIGKTCLTRAAADTAAGKGFAVFWSRCHEGQYVPPYWPWKRMLRDLLDLAHRSKDGPACEGYAGSLATIIPESRQLYPGIPGAPEPGPEQALLRILDGAAGLVKTVSARRPLLLILDNLHCADGPSLRLMEFLAREMADWKVAIVVAHRDAPQPGSGPFWETLGALAGEGLFTSIRLGGWDRTAVKEYLRISLAAEPPAGLAEAVHERTEGNPLFVAEVARLLDRDGLLDPEARSQGGTWEIHLPEKVRLAILGRMQQLSAPCRGMLAVAALAGRECDAALLREVAGEEDASLEDILQEALGNGLIEEAGEVSGRYRFTHVLIQEAGKELVPAPRRAVLHRRIAEAMERRFGSSADVNAGELARHFEAAGPEAAEKAIRYRRLAGERALEACGFEDGLEQFSRALALGGGLPDRERAELLFRLAQCQHALGRYKLAVENHGRAFDLYVREGNIEQAIQVLAQPYILSEQGMGILPLLERAISLVGRDADQAHRLGCHYGLCLYQETGDSRAATRVFRGAVREARRKADRAQEMMTRANWARVLHDELRFEESRRMAGRAIAMAVEGGSLWMQGVSLAAQTIALLGLGRLPDAEASAQRFLLVAERMHTRMALVCALYECCAVKRVAGDLAAALRVSDRAISLGPVPLSSWNLADRALLEYEQGNSREGATYLEKVLETAESADMPFHWDGWVAFLIPYIVWLVAEPLPLERAEADARQVASSPGMRRGDAVNVSAGLGLIAVMRGDDKAARKHYGELEPFSGMVVCPYYGVTADHLLGLLAQAMDDLPAACGHFDAALAFCRSSGLLLELAYTCRDYARLLAAGTSREDWDRASAFCREAERIAQSAGLVPLMRTLRELRKTLEEKTRGVRAGEPSPGPRGPEAGGAPGSLSRRELDVLRLLTGGLSNEQIGDRLFISPHTVANHVQRILEKTGTSNRTDAAVFAVRHGLALPGITS